jgi:ketosteroid isomerase-like protein
METIISEIEEMVNKETTAWNNKDAELLVSIFHKDMVWPWPVSNKDHNPKDWVIEWGRFNYERWKSGWQKLFDENDLIHNNRKIIEIKISKEKDGAFAVVDVDTLWRNKINQYENHWVGLAGKGYTKIGNEWKLIMHTGILDYTNESLF